MLPERHRALDDEVCPVSDYFLGELYRSSLRGIDGLVAPMGAVARATLAMYCYRRAHLTSIGLAVAATCEQDDLTRLAGQAGELLFSKSREAPQPLRLQPYIAARSKITLASGMLRKVVAFEDEEVEES